MYMSYFSAQNFFFPIPYEVEAVDDIEPLISGIYQMFIDSVHHPLPLLFFSHRLLITLNGHWRGSEWLRSSQIEKSV